MLDVALGAVLAVLLILLGVSVHTELRRIRRANKRRK